MPLQIRPAVEADSDRIGWIGRDAFRDYSVSEAIFPPHLHHKSETGDIALDEATWRAARNLARMREGKPTFVAVDVPEDGSEAEQIVAVAQWDVPSPPTAAGEHGDAQKTGYYIQEPLPPSLDQDALFELYKAVEEETKKALGPDGHSKMFYLMSLAVDPAQQRRGIGRKLMHHGLELASKAGMDVFLIATPAGRGLYESLGFRPIGESFLLSDTPHYAMLWRRPDAGSA
ncbi:puromycin N-acetyltransferase [Achaetomium macrosporum]|uniref:Puromycin N-acetyltransferase n=1 Tax=Achaetomium macrosporum TaxID=79813 RepID=A0AAN7C3X0_9PEZI|nr:puromycin N-acetyltransferase [Achaetomium macrosporum]